MQTLVEFSRKLGRADISANVHRVSHARKLQLLFRAFPRLHSYLSACSQSSRLSSVDLLAISFDPLPFSALNRLESSSLNLLLNTT